MSVPNLFHVVQKLFDTGVFDLKTHEGHGAFVDACVSAFHATDERWGHLKKKRGQTAVHGHGEDAGLYKFNDGTAIAVDFIVGAGGPDPKPRWGVDSFPYTHNDWLDPTLHGVQAAPAPPPAPVVRVPSYEEIGGDAFYRAMVGVPLFADYLMADQSPNDGMAVWFSRPTFSLVEAFIKADGKPIDPAAIVKGHRNECRRILGLPPV